jgi:hypothetical protein
VSPAPAGFDGGSGPTSRTADRHTDNPRESFDDVVGQPAPPRSGGPGGGPRFPGPTPPRFTDPSGVGGLGGPGGGGRDGEGTFGPSMAVAIRCSTTPKPDEPPSIATLPSVWYTEAARAQRVEGFVELQIVLGASGAVRVDHVVHGLDFGLTDAARAAALALTFTPARRNGHPIDCPARLTVIFRLISAN